LSITATNATTAVFKYENFFENISISKTITSTVPLVRKNAGVYNIVATISAGLLRLCAELVVSPTDGNPLADYRSIKFHRTQFGLVNGTTLGAQLNDKYKFVMLVDDTGKQITGAGVDGGGISLTSNFGSPYGCP